MCRNESNTVDSKSILSRFCSEYIISKWKTLALSIICTCISSICTIAVAYLVKPIIDDVFVDKNIYALSGVAFGFLFVSLLRGISDYIEAILLNDLWQNIIKKIQVLSFKRLISADLHFFHESKCGDIISKLTNDINSVKNVITSAVSSLCKDLFVVIGILILIFYRDPYFSIIAIIGFSATVLPTINVGKKVKKISSNTQQEMSEWVSFLTQSFQGIRMIKSYNLENYEEQKADSITTNVLELSVKAAKTKAIIHPIIEFLSGVAVSIIVFVGGWLVISGSRTPGTLLSFLTALIMIYRPVKSLANSSSLLYEAVASMTRIYEIIDLKPNIDNKYAQDNIKITNGNISFKNVSFRYSEERDNVLNNIDIEIPSGTSLALVGKSGAGKSTLMNLIPRFYDTTSGDIIIDRNPVKNFKLENLRNSISLVSQDIVLFNDSILNNIKLGRIDATFDEIKNAAKIAAALDFIEQLPCGFNTVIGDNGVLLSGGQKQRISIARAVLKNSPILLLDEATSALDTESEKKIQIALAELMKNRTSIIIAHRLSTIVNADKIAVMDSGKIIEIGTHSELIEKNGVYAHFYNTANCN